jgi:hypothetical protein
MRVIAAVALAVATTWLVPWKVLSPGDAPPRAQLVVYWLPASRDDMRHSDLLTSRTLTTYASQCVAMMVVRPDDYERVAKLDARGTSPLVLLADGEGHELTRIDDVRLANVEKSLKDEVHEREEEALALLDQAKETCASDKDAAVAMYRRVWDQRCLLPRQGREAGRALRKLGVDVE